jgi:glyoxylase-like metal-dependent hydrolase (beta-lactamase superfamily II)
VSQIRCVRANNASAMTLDGTQTYVIGAARVAVIDPGPLWPEHQDAVADAVGSATPVSILVTHEHPDHAEGAHALAARLKTQISRPAENAIVDTDAGRLRAVATPGHTPDHLAFFLEEARALFCGDLMMGGMDTALVALPEGDLHLYLESLERVRALGPAVIYPAHGPAFHEPAAAIDRYVQHRLERVQQVTDALKDGPRTSHQLVSFIYGHSLDAQLHSYAANAVQAYLAYLQAEGKVRCAHEQWSLV